MKKTVKIFNRQHDSFVEIQADTMECDEYLIITPETSLIQLGDYGIVPQIGNIVEVESMTFSIVCSWRHARQRLSFGVLILSRNAEQSELKKKNEKVFITHVSREKYRTGLREFQSCSVMCGKHKVFILQETNAELTALDFTIEKGRKIIDETGIYQVEDVIRVCQPKYPVIMAN